MKHLFWLPTDLLRNLTLILPRALFVRTYQPTLEPARVREENYRNAARLAAYKAKRTLR